MLVDHLPNQWYSTLVWSRAALIWNLMLLSSMWVWGSIYLIAIFLHDEYGSLNFQDQRFDILNIDISIKSHLADNRHTKLNKWCENAWYRISILSINQYTIDISNWANYPRYWTWHVLIKSITLLKFNQH